MRQSANFGRRIGVSFPIFDGSGNEDVFESLDKFKRAATLNGWNDGDLPIGLPLYLKRHASAWFKRLQGANEMTFDELSTAMINQFASRATQWRIRQTLSQLRQFRSKRSLLLIIRTMCVPFVLGYVCQDLSGLIISFMVYDQKFVIM